ncbi:MAG TPA: PAS domain-containing protein [Chryseosolibacter sp.]
MIRSNVAESIEYRPAQWNALTGYSVQELEQKKTKFFFGIIHPEDLEAVRAEKMSTKANTDLNCIEYRIICENGDVKYVKDQFITYCTELDETFTEGYISETQQVNIRLRLLHQLKAYRDAVDVNMISSITDTRGKIIYANDNFCKISQYSVKELIGQNHRIIRSGYHAPEFFSNLWNTISSGKLWHGEILNRAKDGSTYWVDTVIIPIFNEQRVIVNYLSLRMLISDRKFAEDQNRTYTEMLEKIAFMVAHEIRGPLCRILGLVNILSHADNFSTESQTALRYLQTAANDLNELTRELSNFVFEHEIELKMRRGKKPNTP